MMKIVVVGANGHVGRLIVADLVAKNEDVTAIVRGENHTEAKKAIVADVMNLTRKDLEEFDVVIDALGGWTADTVDVIPNGEKHLADLLEGTDTKLYVVGGAGSLYVDPDRKTMLMEGPDFPEIFVPVATAHGKALADLKDRKNLNWVYISPAADFQADGEETGKVLESDDHFMVNKDGQSFISYKDYAKAFVNEVLKGTHHNKQISYLAA